MTGLPVTVIGGYLGSGKTTLINHLLRHADGRKLAVLVNEFGELAIDEDLIEAQDENLISISGGCICCSFGDNLVGAITDLANLDPRPEHIVIEASGVAIPSSIAGSLSLLQGYALNGVIVLADCTTVQGASKDEYIADTILRQLQDADLVIATKTDQATPSRVDQVSTWLTATAKGARVIRARHGKVSPDVVLGPLGSGKHHVQAPHSDSLFESCVFDLYHPVDIGRLSAALSRTETGLVRAKGFVRDASGKSFLIQLVGQRVDITKAGLVDRYAMVCIALAGQLDRAGLADLFQRTKPERTTQGRPNAKAGTE